MKRILVTGGAGFIGSHLCRKLLSLGHKVVCLDNLITGRRCNVEDLFSNPNFFFMEHDVVNPVTVEVEEIYHLASPASPPQYMKYPIETAKANALGTISLLELADQRNIRMVFTSTSEVYGEPLVHPQSESYWGNVNCFGNRSCYDESKRLGETMCRCYRDERGVDVRIVRIFNTYGPSMAADDGRVVSNFINQALRNIPITIYGTGKQTRSFQYIDDLIEGLVKAMNCATLETPVNLGNPEEYSMLALAEAIINKVGSKSELAFVQSPMDDPTRRKPDIAFAKRVLDWSPKVTLDVGLSKTVEYFRRV